VASTLAVKALASSVSTLPVLTMVLKLLSLATSQVSGTAALLPGILACVHKMTRSASGSPLATP